MKKYALLLFAMMLIFGIVEVADATLYNRGNGMIFDDVLDITWLQDCDFARTSGSYPSAWMSWDDAIAWTDQLVYGGYDDWRLPHLLPVNGVNYDLTISNDGSTDQGYNISAPGSAYPGSTASELAYMFYNNLGNSGWVDPHGNEQVFTFGLKNIGPFIGLKPGGYWSLTDYALTSGRSLNFNFFNGLQETVDNQTYSYAWAVRDGDVSPVPEPATLFLLGSGLLGIIGLKKHRKH